VVVEVEELVVELVEQEEVVVLEHPVLYQFVLVPLIQ
jgi:hypothetical protein